MSPAAVTSVQDLRRIAEAVGQLHDRTVREVRMRSDCRQLRLTLDDGRILLVSVCSDENGLPRLDVDVLHAPSDRPRTQLEVRFEAGT